MYITLTLGLRVCSVTEVGVWVFVFGVYNAYAGITGVLGYLGWRVGVCLRCI